MLQAAARAAERRARDNVWCPCGDHGTGIGYTNDDGGVIILDNASSQIEQSDQRGSGGSKIPRSSSDISIQANMPCSTTLSSSANLSSRDARLLAAGSHNRSLLDSSQQQHVHQCDCTAGEVVSLAVQEQPMAQQKDQLQNCDVKGSMACSTAGWQPGSGSSDLVDLTLDDAAVLPAHEPKSKRLRYQQHGTSHLSLTSTSECLSAIGQTASAAQYWTCSVCTLLNQNLSLQCCACGTVRPAGLYCSKLSHGQAVSQPQPVSGAVSFNGNTWSCKFCSLVNAPASSHCTACIQWRYSYGAPHASRPTI